MKHKSYRNRLRKSLTRSIRRTQNTKRLRGHTKRLHTKRSRRHTKRSRKVTKKYRLRGGNKGVQQAAMPAPKFTEIPPPLPSDTLGVQAKLAADAAAQNAANHKLAGGKKQRGGGATICSGTALNGPDGYGYISPNNCLLVPTVNSPDAQAHTITAMHTLNISNSQSPGDTQVGVMPK
jgi:hypothetical protein